MLKLCFWDVSEQTVRTEILLVLMMAAGNMSHSTSPLTPVHSLMCCYRIC
jgi:hypothetical protein